MTQQEAFKLGTIIKLFSFKGEVVVRFEVPYPLTYRDLDRVFVEVGQELVPYFIERSSHKSKDQFRFAFEDVNAEAEARALVGCSVYLPLEEKDHDDELGPEFVGYHVVDEHLGAIGEVTAFLDLPSNPQLEVTQGDREFLIPLQDAFIRAIDTRKKVITTDLPEGLVDL